MLTLVHFVSKFLSTNDFAKPKVELTSRARLQGSRFNTMVAMSVLDRFIDHSPALRCSRAEAIGRITAKSLVKDAGFGDCPMQIAYEFSDASGQLIAGKHVGTESSYYGLKTGDQISIRYLESDSKTNSPKDALGIIRPVADDNRHG